MSDGARRAGLSTLAYQDIVAVDAAAKAKESQTALDIEHESQRVCVLTIEERDAMLAASRSEGAAERDGQLRQEYQQRFDAEAVKIVAAVAAFEHERQDYFSRVEGEVVKLSLAIASKVLHREAQVDPMLLAALVKVAIDQLHDGSKVSVRIPPGDAARWREFFRTPRNGISVEVIEDAHLGPQDCVLGTDLGSANFNIEGQLKEVEQGFFDLLALRPQP